MILPALFDYLEESFSYKDIQFKKFCLPMKTNTAFLLITLITTLLMERASHDWRFSIMG